MKMNEQAYVFVIFNKKTKDLVGKKGRDSTINYGIGEKYHRFYESVVTAKSAMTRLSKKENNSNSFGIASVPEPLHWGESMIRRGVSTRKDPYQTKFLIRETNLNQFKEFEIV